MEIIMIDPINLFKRTCNVGCLCLLLLLTVILMIHSDWLTDYISYSGSNKAHQKLVIAMIILSYVIFVIIFMEHVHHVEFSGKTNYEISEENLKKLQRNPIVNFKNNAIRLFMNVITYHPIFALDR